MLWPTTRYHHWGERPRQNGPLRFFWCPFGTKHIKTVNNNQPECGDVWEPVGGYRGSWIGLLSYVNQNFQAARNCHSPLLKKDLKTSHARRRINQLWGHIWKLKVVDDDTALNAMDELGVRMDDHHGVCRRWLSRWEERSGYAGRRELFVFLAPSDISRSGGTGRKTEDKKDLILTPRTYTPLWREFEC